MEGLCIQTWQWFPGRCRNGSSLDLIGLCEGGISPACRVVLDHENAVGTIHELVLYNVEAKLEWGCQSSGTEQELQIVKGHLQQCKVGFDFASEHSLTQYFKSSFTFVLNKKK